MSAQTSVLNLNSGIAASNAGRSRTLAIILMVAIAGVFWIGSRYPRFISGIPGSIHRRASCGIFLLSNTRGRLGKKPTSHSAPAYL
jgi:hypothetical protein